MNKRAILAVVSDSHAGYSLGLMNPEVKLQEELEDGTLEYYTPELTRSQRILWPLYLRGIQQVKTIAKTSPILYIHNGDIAHGNKYASQLVSTRPADQVLIALANQDPWMELKNVVKYRFVTGTDAHSLGEASAEALVTSALRRQHPKKDIAMLDHELLDVLGHPVDYAHHGPPPGSREDLKGNSARNYLKNICNLAVHHDELPPRLVLRGHYHELVVETIDVLFHGHYVRSTIVLLPSFTFPSLHTIQAVRSLGYTTIGMMAFEFTEDDMLVHRLVEEYDVRTREAFCDENPIYRPQR